MEVPDIYRMTFTGEQFFQADLRGPTCLLLFALVDTIQVLCHADHWFVNGTFKTCPDLIYQFYTIHALKPDRVLPCVYALLSNNAPPTYSINQMQGVRQTRFDRILNVFSGGDKRVYRWR